MRRLASLELNDKGGFQGSRPASVVTTVLEAFLQGVGGTAARQQVALTSKSDIQETWSHDLMALVQALAVLMYPCQIFLFQDIHWKNWQSNLC